MLVVDCWKTVATAQNVALVVFISILINISKYNLLTSQEVDEFLVVFYLESFG